VSFTNAANVTESPNERISGESHRTRKRCQIESVAGLLRPFTASVHAIADRTTGGCFHLSTGHFSQLFPKQSADLPGNQMKPLQHAREEGIEFRRALEHEPVAHVFHDAIIGLRRE